MPFMSVYKTKIHYQWGGKNEGKVLILLHGWSASIPWWTRVIPMLSKEYRLLLIDLPGHGLSSSLPTQLCEKPIVAISSILHSIINTLGIEKPVLVGWSLGGMVSLQYVLDHPKTLSNLILVDTSAVGKIMPSYGFLPQIPYYCIPDLKKLLSLIKMQLFVSEKLLTSINKMRIRKSVASLLVYLLATGKKPDKNLVAWATEILLQDLNIGALLQMAIGTLLYYDVVDKLHEVDIPTLIIHGREDRFLSLWVAELLQRKIHGSKLTVIDGVGHCPHLEKPEEFNKEVIAFLNKLTS